MNEELGGLKPCPFCGDSEPTFTYGGDGMGGTLVYVCCHTCDAQSESAAAESVEECRADDVSKATVAGYWNRRTPATAGPDLRERVAKQLFKWSREDFEEITMDAVDTDLEWHAMDADGRENWYIRADAIIALASHAPPACPDLRERVLAQYEIVPINAPMTETNGRGAQCVGGKWYLPKWGCDTLEHVLESLTAHTEAGEATR